MTGGYWDEEDRMFVAPVEPVETVEAELVVPFDSADWMFRRITYVGDAS